MNRKALFPGSFDPFTKGHEAIVHKSLTLFDEVIIGIGFNASKTYYFPIEKRIEHIKSLFKNTPGVRVLTYSKLTVEFAKENNAFHIIRGLRDGKDFDYEKSIALMNKDLNEQIETVFLLTDNIYGAINSTIVREIHKNEGGIEKFVTNSHLL
ncbi:MAG: pantetheine-phosphate adenylyltransferase [Bacteroidetes bacterium]|nr:pantetheine-phosphate adenylyltransferase [Bacteroidota bacterium]